MGAISQPATDVSDLYCALSSKLERRVRRDVRAPDVVIEDACQFAWTRLVDKSDRVRSETALAWLVKTAVREALKLIRHAGRELSLEAALERAEDPLSASPHELLEYRARLAELDDLPERQQRLLWLHAAGLSYAEMAAHEGCTRRTVERQLLRARRRVREGGSPSASSRLPT
jgi:RNA polymerase sigma factor (sigma-70 family)